jgi:hypothetical protein
MVKVLVIDSHLVSSKAFLNLSGIAPQVYFLFLRRRRMVKTGRKGKEKWVIENNGEIVFPYAEAITKFGLTRPRFLRAIDQLVEHGFIDIVHSGGGMMKDVSKYAISERWKEYGTNNFIHTRRPKDTRGLGFKKKRLNIGNENVQEQVTQTLPEEGNTDIYK